MEKEQIKPFIAKRAAQELHDGDVVNLGIGLPTLIPNFLPEGVHVVLPRENGMIGMGPTPEEGKEDPWFINAGGGYITHVPGASTFDSATSFGIIRGGHVDVSVLGAMQVDEEGDLANWMIPGKKTPGTLPLTAKGQVNMIITEMGVMEITSKGIVLTEINPEFTVEQVQAATEAQLIISPDLKPMNA